MQEFKREAPKMLFVVSEEQNSAFLLHSYENHDDDDCYGIFGG